MPVLDPKFTLRNMLTKIYCHFYAINMYFNINLYTHVHVVIQILYEVMLDSISAMSQKRSANICKNMVNHISV